MQTKERINITVDKDLLVRVRDMAEAESRNLSNMIEYLLRIAVEDNK